MVKDLLKLKRKMRFLFISVFLNLLRIVMLSFRLRLLYLSEKIHPIAVVLCGIVSNILGISKMFRDKKALIKIKKVKHHHKGKRCTSHAKFMISPDAFITIKDKVERENVDAL